ncbi:D-allose-binding periplasmic protein [bacterium HR17]|uniref:D-allose-binding periplasmic protein n=1 Tax=Candidatus Fervidibacter japonicus TaxID=2035412 RepID=A0A2H5XDH1_9BACT|nr:D-allose-binding periplasmic protein [bacterium HR17]
MVCRRYWIVLSAVVTICACLGAAPAFKTKKPGQTVLIAGIGKSLHAYWREVELGMRAAAKKLRGCRVRWFVPSKEDVRAQVSTFESLLAQGVDGIVIGPSNPAAIKGAVQRALSAGVPVVTFDTDAPDSGRLLYIGTDNYKAGYEAGKVMVKVLNGRGKVAICTGSLTALNSVQRIDGFKAALKGTQVQVVEVYNDNEDRAKALANAQAALQRYPDLAGFFGVYAFNGPACAQAVKMMGRAGKVKIVCFDTTAEHMQLIRQGLITATIGQRPFMMGYRSAEILYRMVTEGVDKVLRDLKLDRLPPEKRQIDTGIDVVTKATMNAYRKRLLQLGIPVQGW